MVGPVQEWYPPMFGIYDFYPPRPRASILSRIGTRTLTLTSSKKILSAVIALPLLKFFLAWLHYRSYQQKSQAQNYTRRKITQGVKKVLDKKIDMKDNYTKSNTRSFSPREDRRSRALTDPANRAVERRRDKWPESQPERRRHHGFESMSISGAAGGETIFNTWGRSEGGS
jgi:hypothetical protein